MGVYAKDGTPHHSASRAKMHDEMHAGKPKAEEPEPKKPMGEESSGEDIKEVVAKHGPAHEMHYKHDEATGKHHVHSKHKDHEHHSDHESSEAAHEHMGEALGHGEPDADDEEMGEEAGEEMPAMMEHSGQHIPGL